MTGTTISHYQIEQELGRGGMGVVYKARDTRLNRTVAIKVLPAHALASEEDRARFYREAQAAAALSHANIATIYEIDESAVIPAKGGISAGQAVVEGEPQPFIVMEYVEGEPLADRIAKGPLPLKQAIAIASQIADGLHAAHAKNIVHRDIKSGNVMLTAEGRAKILDFGLAKTAASTRLTNLGSTLGTIAYMSPEQARGEEVDRRTDIWSLGAVLYEMITGRMPFPGDYEQAVVYGILNEEPEPATALRTGVPMELERIVAKCLAKDAARRYQHADELAVDLDSVDIRPSGLSTIAPAVAAPAGSRSRSLNLPVVTIVALAAAAIGALAVALLRPAEEAPRVSRQHLLVDQERPYHPALSPDGRLLAFGGYDSRSKLWGLHIYSFETGDVTTFPDLSPGDISFSADGSKIKYHSGGKLLTVATAGGTPTVVADYDGQGGSAWGPDGELYYRDQSAIMRVAGAGEQPRLIISPDTSKEEVAMYPYQMLPGGRHLLVGVTRGSPEHDDLIAVDVETGKATDLLQDAGWLAAYAPSGHIVYVTQERGPLYARPFDPRKLEFLGPVAQALPSVNDQSWVFSGSGRFANIVRSLPRRRMLTVDSEGSPRALPVDTAYVGRFRVSPTGRHIAFSRTDDGDRQVYILDAVTTSLRQLTFRTSNVDPAWSPTGEAIAYSSRHEETTQRLYMVRADGSGSARLLARTVGHARQPDWSPDGDHIIFNTEGDLWLYSFSDSSAHPFDPAVNENGSQYQPRFSPDGRFITYGSNEMGSGEVFVASADGKSKWRVTKDGGYAPTWSRDRNHLYYAKDSDIYEVAIETEPVFRTVGQPRIAYASEKVLGWFDLLPDGEGFVVSESVGSATSHFEIVDNWFQYLEQIAPHRD